MLILVGLFATYMNRRLIRYIRERRNAEAISIIDHHIQSRDLFGYKRRTLLHYAVECDNSVIAQYLIDRGWNLETTDTYGETALTVALKRGSTDSVSVLLDAMKCNFNIRDYVRQASLTFPNDFQMVKLLLDKLVTGCCKNSDIARKLLEFKCPLAVAVCIYKNAKLTKLMLDGGSPVDDRLDTTGETALHLAIQYSDIDNVKILVKHGAEINANGVGYCPPLSRFKMSSDDPDKKLEILKFLLDKGASLTAPCPGRRRFHNIFYVFQRTPTIQSKLLSQEDNRVLQLVIPYIQLFQWDASGRQPIHYLKKNKTVLKISRGKCPDAAAGARCGSPWTGLLKEENEWRSKSIRFKLTTRKNYIKYPKDVDNYLSLKHILYDDSEWLEVASVVEFFKMYTDADIEKFYENTKLANSNINYILFDPSATKYSDVAKLLIAKLAVLESFGMTLSSSIVEKIKSYKIFRDDFHSCKQQIVKMKETTVYESVTLYKLLLMHGKSLIACARNEEFQRNYEFLKNTICNVCPTYANVLIASVEKAIIYANKENKAACVFCRITGLSVIIGESMVGYLDLKDLENLSEI